VLLVVSIHHPRLPLGQLWLPLPSALVYAAVAVASVCVRWVSRPKLKPPGKMPIEPRLLARGLRKMAWVALCSGSYVLVDVSVPSERVKVKVRLI